MKNTPTIIGVLSIGLICVLSYSVFRPTISFPVSTATPRAASFLKSNFLQVTQLSGQATTTVPRGERNAILLSFEVVGLEEESVELTSIAMELDRNGYGENIISSDIHNMLLEDQDRARFGQATRTISKDKAIYIFRGKKIIPRAGSTKLTLRVDVPSESTAREVTAVVLHDKYFTAHTTTTRQALSLKGDVRGELYLKPADSTGALTISSDIAYNSKYPRQTKDAVLAKIFLNASFEESITVTKIALRLSNYVPGQYKNVKLIQQDGSQFANTVQSPQVIDSTYPNVVFKGNIKIKSGTTSTLNLVSDIDIPSKTASKYGPLLQRSADIYDLYFNEANNWITANGEKSGEHLYINGGFSSPLQFTE